MQDRSVEHRLREEYFDNLPEIRRVLWQLETEIRFRTLPILHDLKGPEQLVIRSRVKDCESALKTLARLKGSSSPEGRQFDPSRAEHYSILSLPDLAGVRVLVFPNRRLGEVDSNLRPYFKNWLVKPIKNDHGEIIAPKYYGYCKEVSSRIQGEYQIVPMLLGLFWEVEHSAMYKFRAVANSKEMRSRRARVEEALADFEQGVERFL
jgi:hypothetical protein